MARDPTLEAALAAAMKGKAVPAVGALEIRNGQIAGEAARGLRRLDRPDLVTARDRWHLGSDTKAMTATLIARLVDERTLSWDTRLDQLLPMLAATMRPEYHDITLVELLSHRSGLPENVGDEAFLKTFYDDNRPLREQRLAYIARALSETPVGPARRAAHYSNTGLLVAAAAAERATSQAYEQLMVQKVFGPLGMSSATFSQAAEGEPVGHVDGRPATLAEDPNPAMFNPAGQARMSLPDWATFCIDQMNGAKGRGRILKTETYRFMQTAQGETRSGLGWGASPTVQGRQGPALTHSGSDGNWYAVVVLFPESGNGLLVAANAAESMGGDKAVKAVVAERLPSIAPPASSP